MRLGILGGTFDPIHYAHLLIGEEACVRFGLEQVLFIPNAVPPHKSRHLASPADRYEMTRLATDGNPAFAPSRLEIDRPGRSFTIDTLRQVQTEQPAADIYFITGTDAIAEIATWRQPEEVARLCTFVAVERDGWPAEAVLAEIPRDIAARVVPMPAIPLAISSTDIRRRVRAGLPIRYLTPEPVVDYISARQMYRDQG